MSKPVLTLEDGGPAFPKPLDPYPNVQDVRNEHDAPSGGMSLRDWFAGQALSSGHCRHPGGLTDGDLTAYFGPDRTNIRREEVLAAEAYAIADALLASRLRAVSQP